MTRRATALTEVAGLIRERRAALDVRMAAGEIAAARPLTYTKPRGPLIAWGPHGWTTAMTKE